MKKIPSLTSYEAYKSLANSKYGFPGDKDFIDLLIPALKEVSDEVIEIILPQWQISTPIIKFTAIHVAIIREYVIRVENTEREEWEAQKRLAEVRLNLQNDPAYTGIHKRDNSDIAQNDLYSTYSIQQFQDEIDFLCKRSVEAQLNNDHFTYIVLNEQIQRLSDRQLELRRKIDLVRGTSWIKNNNNW